MEAAYDWGVSRWRRHAAEMAKYAKRTGVTHKKTADNYNHAAQHSETMARILEKYGVKTLRELEAGAESNG